MGVVGQSAAHGRVDPRSWVPIAYFWGEDAFAIDRAASAFASEFGDPEAPLESWRSPTEDETGTEGSGGASAARRRSRVLDEASSRLTTAPLFGGGALVVLRQPGWLVRESSAADRVHGMIGAVAPGNALVITDLIASGGKAPAAGGSLRDAVAAAGGRVREFPTPTRERLEAWITGRGAELGVRMGPGAARLLTERLGGYVREADVDRRHQTEMANAELEKLALYRPGGIVSRDDVTALVAEAVPGSIWAFLDAAAGRQAGDASRLAARLADDGTAQPVLISQLHRRFRELILVREHLNSGARPQDLVVAMRLQPFRAQKLAEQAATWTLPALEEALNGVLELDLHSKGISLDGSTAQMSEARDALGLQLWIARHLTRR